MNEGEQVMAQIHLECGKIITERDKLKQRIEKLERLNDNLTKAALSSFDKEDKSEAEIIENYILKNKH